MMTKNVIRRRSNTNVLVFVQMFTTPVYTIHHSPNQKTKTPKGEHLALSLFFLIKVRQQSGANNNNNRQKKLDWKPPSPHHHHHHQIFIHLYEENRKATRPFHCIR